jgi:histone deacetylase complex regulatory component SIN3
MNTYEIKQDISGNDYLEMTTPDGVVSFVPMVAGNSDYENYLNPKAEQSTPILPGDAN